MSGNYCTFVFHTCRRKIWFEESVNLWGILFLNIQNFCHMLVFLYFLLLYIMGCHLFSVSDICDHILESYGLFSSVAVINMHVVAGYVLETAWTLNKGVSHDLIKISSRTGSVSRMRDF